MVKNKTSKTNNSKGQAFFELFAGLVLLIILNILAGYFFTRIDFTKEKRYTLNDSSKELVSTLDDIVYVQVYLEGEFPAGFKRLRESTKEMLDEFRAYSKGNLQYDFVNPLADKDQETQKEIIQQLVNQGLQPTNLQVKNAEGSSQQIIVPGAIITYKGRQVPLQLLQNQQAAGPQEAINNSIQGLEYQIANSLKKITTVFKSKVGFVDGHGELDSLSTADLVLSLSDFYSVDRVDISNLNPDKLNEAAEIINTFDLLIIAKPTKAFQEKEKFLIDQFIMNGGKVIWAIDAMNASLDSLDVEGNSLSIPFELNIADQLFKYGARINSNLVLDLNCAPIPLTFSGNTQLIPWLFYPIFVPRSAHPIVKNLDAIRTEFVSTIDIIEIENIKATPILSTSPYTKMLLSPVRVNLGMAALEPNPDQFDMKDQTVAVLLEGKFESVFKNRLTAQSVDFLNPLDESAESKMIVIGDGDLMKNAQSKGNAFPLGYDRYTQTTFANKDFMLNCIDYLLDDNGLLALRTKEFKLRLLDKAKVKEQKTTWQIINLVGPVLFLVIFGLVFNAIRKRKFAK
ncbi:MAG: ABC-2 type transport system permease protein [Sphingobacteriales bacterium]|jgi:ABC-2 type transport system permease protein